MRNAALATFLRGGVIETLSAGAAKYSKLTPWDIGQSVFRSEVSGDSLNAWANRGLSYGTNASPFDSEGLPAQRVELIRDNKLMTFIAGQRYADYLGIAPTGAFGDLEVAPGTTPASSLLAEPYVEIVAFSWFNPDTVTGDFTSEIRLGYIVDGEQRRPFKGGVLVGNVLNALANVRWSQETGFFGDYHGPTTARFIALQVAGDDIS
jgi:predicted Zn-dependent protease